MPTRYGLINLAGEFVLEPRYDDVSQASDGGPTCVTMDADKRRITPDGHLEGGKQWYVTRDGATAFEAEFEEAGRFSDARASVRVAKKWGYIDWSGGFCIEPQFDAAFAFQGGLAKVKIGNRYGIIDRQGESVHPPDLVTAGNYSCGLVQASLASRTYGYLDIRGRWAIAPRYRWLDDFSDGVAFVANADFIGYIDINGRQVIEFDQARRLRGFAKEPSPELARDIDDSVPPAWTGRKFSEGLAKVSVQEEYAGEVLSGYIDLNGDLVIPPSFESAGRFRGGYTTVEVAKRWGIINRTGHYTVPPTYEDAFYGFGCGLAAVKEAGVYRYVDPSGTPAFGGKTFAWAGLFQEGVARVGIAEA